MKSNQVQKHGGEFAAAVNDLLSNGQSEADLRFAHPDAPVDYGIITADPTYQIFGKNGAKAAYRTPPANINDGSPWEFFGTSQIPQVGSDKAELIAVLPNVTQEFCDVVNTQLGFTLSSVPTDNTTGSTPDCVMGASTDRFTGSFNDISPNILDGTTFSRLPAMQACVSCETTGENHYYYVLLAR